MSAVSTDACANWILDIHFTFDPVYFGLPLQGCPATALCNVTHGSAGARWLMADRSVSAQQTKDKLRGL
jgi:hypothetical protein